MGYDTTLKPHNIAAPGSPCPWAPGDGRIVGTIEYTDVVGGTATVAVGTVPAGARYLDCKFKVVTAFNGGANNALIVGIPTDTDYLIEDGHPTEANAETPESNVRDWTPTADTVVSMIYTHTGSVPTTGKAWCVVYFDRPL